MHDDGRGRGGVHGDTAMFTHMCQGKDISHRCRIKPYITEVRDGGNVSGDLAATTIGETKERFRARTNVQHKVGIIKDRERRLTIK